jgi:hypothetical protein
LLREKGDIKTAKLAFFGIVVLPSAKHTVLLKDKGIVITADHQDLPDPVTDK